MDYKDFYKKLIPRINDPVLPYGFRNSGLHFRRLHENGIALEIAIQKSRSNTKKLHTITVNVNMGLLPTPVTKTWWKGSFLQTWRHLGVTLEDGLDHQFWYQVTSPDLRK